MMSLEEPTRGSAANALMRFLVFLVLSLPYVVHSEIEDGQIVWPPSIKQSARPDARLILYVNGFSTDASDALKQAENLSRQLGEPVGLVFNDLTHPVIDAFSILIEKAGDADCSVNAATRSLVESITRAIESGREIALIGHSAGSLCIMNAVNAVAASRKQKDNTRTTPLLKRIHVLTIGAATFASEHCLADGWPILGSIHHLWDEQDAVAGLFGLGDVSSAFACSEGDRHGLLTHYIKHVQKSMLSQSGNTIIK